MSLSSIYTLHIRGVDVKRDSAASIHEYGGPSALQYVEAPRPKTRGRRTIGRVLFPVRVLAVLTLADSR